MISNIKYRPALRSDLEFGRRILNDLIEEAIESEKTIKLSVLKTNKAKNLYSNVGFKIVGETDDSYLMLFENYVREKRFCNT